jgi:hypothetical protein
MRGAAPLAVLLVACTAACAPRSGGDGEAPHELADGSATTRWTTPPLEDVEQPIRTRVRVVRAGEVARAVDRCARGGWSVPPTGDAVLRAGAYARTVTLRGTGGRGLYACDGTGSRWCASVFGRLVRRRLADPRLDLVSCPPERQPVAVAWIEPSARARYVVLHHPGFAEVYPTAARMPVRVASHAAIDVDHSTATFHISEHAADGRKLLEYELRTSVAG